MKLNRRSLFAGIAGLFAAKQVPATITPNMVRRCPATLAACDAITADQISAGCIASSQIRPIKMFSSVESAPAGEPGQWGFCTGDFALYIWREKWEPFKLETGIIADAK